MFDFIKNIKIGKRFLIINAITVIGILAISYIGLISLKKELLEDRILKTKSITETASNIAK